METWFLKIVGAVLHLVIGDEDVGKVISMKVCKTANMIKMMLASKAIRRLEMDKFKSDANDLCLTSPRTRSLFIQYWENHGNDSSTISSEFEDSFGSNSNSDLSFDIIEAKETSDSKYNASSQKLSSNNSEEQMLIEYNIGTVEVHLENLIAPHPSRATRILDHEHVKMLKESFSSNNSSGQIIILQGMVLDETVAIDQLFQEGSGNVEVLGGNHTREALQTLLRSGTLAFNTVRCNLYRPLPRVLALRVGCAHNAVLHEKLKPVTFMDKVRLIRELRPSLDMNKEETLKWKDTLVTILNVKDRRRLVQGFSVHLTMANLKHELWTKVCQAAKTNVMSEKLFRGYIRLKDSEKSDPLEILLADGVVPFKKIVRFLLDAGNACRLQKKNKKQQSDETEIDLSENITLNNNTETEEQPDEEYSSWKQKFEDLKEQYAVLEKENLSLRKRLKEMEETYEIRSEKENKRRRCSANIFSKGEKVMAFWRDEVTGEESWQEATVKCTYTDGRCKVVWKSDGMISTPRVHELQKLKNL